MPDAAPFVVFLIATIALNLSPGPDMLYVISRTLANGRRAGIVSAFGIGAGTLVHMSVTAIGLSALLISFPLGYEAIKIAGAVYLIYLGIKILRSNSVAPAVSSAGREEGPIKMLTVFRQGVLTNVLNPKVALFFLAFLPQFVDRSIGLFPLQIIFLGLVFDFSGTTWNVIFAILTGKANLLLKKRAGLSGLQKILPGIVLIMLGALVLF